MGRQPKQTMFRHPTVFECLSAPSLPALGNEDLKRLDAGWRY